MVSLSLSWAEAGERDASTAAPANPRTNCRMRIMTVSWLPRSLQQLLLLSPAQHRRRRHRRIARLDPHVDDHHMTVVDCGDRLLEGRDQLAGLGHRPKTLRALRA